ncbi:hypothetical protein Niako_4899 [Niastella koreensis GR20-10]|uniref:Uncharacterized protein n=1 Tax=Niastella koreensis (strain DSM 17620 / KACC 11465 / NBRC 106392 / GR20-10) TaxID=700598 RepID=G8TRK8_NIAKG|nr:hypothetical protein [Niastella koreensis]AEW01139.1 hypothetical protein Niako_4899 [Niastella koreensis GR20-10]
MKNIKKGKQKSIAKKVDTKAANNYANDPYFVKKRDMASEFLKKAGLPESFKRL